MSNGHYFEDMKETFPVRSVNQLEEDGDMMPMSDPGKKWLLASIQLDFNDEVYGHRSPRAQKLRSYSLTRQVIPAPVSSERASLQIMCQ
jgi:hypothetical protein